MFPLDQLTSAVAALQEKFPATPLRLYVEALGAVVQPMMDGRCAIGVMGSPPTVPPQFTCRCLLSCDGPFLEGVATLSRGYAFDGFLTIFVTV